MPLLVPFSTLSPNALEFMVHQEQNLYCQSIFEHLLYHFTLKETWIFPDDTFFTWSPHKWYLLFSHIPKITELKGRVFFSFSSLIIPYSSPSVFPKTITFFVFTVLQYVTTILHCAIIYRYPGTHFISQWFLTTISLLSSANVLMSYFLMI